MDKEDLLITEADLSRDSVERFQKIIKNVKGVELSYGQSRELATNFYNFMIEIIF